MDNPDSAASSSRHVSFIWDQDQALSQQQTHENPPPLRTPHVQSPPPVVHSPREFHTVNLQPDPPPTPPNHQIASDKGASSKNYRLAEVFFHLICTIILAISIIILIIGFNINRIFDFFGVEQTVNLRGAFITTSIAYMIAIFIGFMASITRSRSTAKMFAISICIIFFISSYYFWASSSEFTDAISAMTDRWNELPNIARSIIQVVGDCCGGISNDDNPGEICSGGVFEGCKLKIKEGAVTLQHWQFYSTLAMLALVFSSVLLCFHLVDKKRAT